MSVWSSLAQVVSVLWLSPPLLVGMAEPSFAPKQTSLSPLFQCLPCSVGPEGLPKVTLNLHSGRCCATSHSSVWLSHLMSENAKGRMVPTEVLLLVLRVWKTHRND